MAEIRELMEKVRGGDRGIEEIIAMMTMMQGQLDTNSFLAGLLFGKSGGRGMDRSLALLMAMSSANTAQQQGNSGTTTNPMQQLLPLLLLLGRDDGDAHSERSFEVAEKKASSR